MDTLWFVIVTAMLGMYVVLDGFDFGVGILHRLVARTDAERRVVLEAIEPYWDGNEVWLIAAGAVLFFAFPRTYATAFSGFYLPLIIVLWLLILRGIAISFRSHQDNPLWREFWDTTFSVASLLMAVVLGAALGNLVRGVPLGSNGSFFLPLFTNFRPGVHAGVFDWYTTLVGIFSLCALTGHGALYLVWKTAGAVHARSGEWARVAWLAVPPLWGLTTLATAWIQPDIFRNLAARPWSLVFVALMFGGIWGVFHFRARGRELSALLSSSAFILGILACTMTGLYPNWLRSTIDANNSVTVANSAAASYGLRAGLYWWTIGITLVGAYFVYVFRASRGKVGTGDEVHGY